jgi:hypothetical protein
MTNLESYIGPVSTRRRIATVIAVIGVLFIGSRLASVWPRDVEVAYQVGPGVSELDVDYLHEGEAVASARFRRGPQQTGLFRHTVRLQPGEYEVLITLYREGGAAELDRSLAAPAPGVVRFDLRSTRHGGERAR